MATAAGLLAPGGTLLVYEWALDDDGDGPRRSPCSTS